MADKDVDVSANENSESDIDVGNDPSGEVEGFLATLTEIAAAPEKEAEPAVDKKAPVEPKKDEIKEEKKEEKQEVVNTADRGLERLAAKEKEIREAREVFEKERSQYIKFADLHTNPSSVLTKVGIDPDVLMKTILYEKLPDGNPVKAKLEAELSKTLTDKKINDLRQEMEARDRQARVAEANARNYHETVQKIEGYVSKFKDADDKTLPTLSTIGKGDAGVLKELIIEELINDAAVRFAKGEDGDPITHEEAASRIEKRLARLLPLINKIAETNDKGSNGNASVPSKKKVTVRPGPAQAKGQPQKTTQQELDDLISNVLSGR